jgi:hypothetical protein
MSVAGEMAAKTSALPGEGEASAPPLPAGAEALPPDPQHPPPRPLPPPATACLSGDPDLDAAALKLDGHSRLLRGDLLAHLVDWQRRQGQRQAEVLQAVGAQGAAGLAAKQRELDAAAAQLAWQREVAKRTGDALFKAARWRRQLTLGCIAWRAWREQARRWVGVAFAGLLLRQMPARTVC